MKPIQFNTGEVRATLDNFKTMTRRAVKPQPRMVYYDGMLQDSGEDVCDGRTLHVLIAEDQNGAVIQIVPPYQPGDILYVRETWRKDVCRYMYKADYSDVEKFYRDGKEVSIKWRPSIHMPRDAARIFLRVTDVRVERLQDITEGQSQKEGLYRGWKLTEKSTPALTAKQAFMWVWDRIIKLADRANYGWIANPWVWVIEFERISREEGAQNA